MRCPDRFMMTINGWRSAFRIIYVCVNIQEAIVCEKWSTAYTSLIHHLCACDSSLMQYYLGTHLHVSECWFCLKLGTTNLRLGKIGYNINKSWCLNE